ncbi:carnitine acetyltransferase [Tremella mesenterica]|uniref:Carnitine acetyltransferase n=1 Tax=Tremella mesenterica TaxID=5217 RepID=A0A4Q1BPL2_TREME|nr:carnitine acetyltransferase [Tremella mesenterica]
MFALSSISHGQPKTFSNQDVLPRLPVPGLDQSLQAYLKSLTPLLEQKLTYQYAGASLTHEVEKRRVFIRDFAAEDGIGRVLQERLKDLDHVSPHNWLDDTLWLVLAYHSWRAPLVVNSNWWLLFAPDPKDRTPSTQDLSQPNPNPTTTTSPGSQGGGQQEWVTDWQIRKSAWILRRLAELRLKLQREEISPDSSRSGPFCMSQYRKLFNFSRIPLPNSDAFSAIKSRAIHATVMIDDRIYSVEVFASPTSPHAVPEPLSPAEIEANLRSVVKDAKQARDVDDNPPKVGLLTADERDQWTKNREHLLLLSPTNRETLDSISFSLVVLSLDTYTLPPSPTDDPLCLPSVDAHLRNVATGVEGGRNRWFDKPISIPVETTGRAGIMGEHSPVDALIPSIAIEYVLGTPVDESQFEGSVKDGSGWKRLEWVVDDILLSEIDQCQKRNQTLIEDSDASQLWWGEYGAEWIKKHAKLSPDAFLQQALQLAWYKDQGYATATYETASTRTMLHGRTDVIRTLSVESRDFVKGMLNQELPDEEKYELLSAACTNHNILTRTSSSGQGFDRHLMGLKTRLREGETHPLFEDELYAKSQEWKLSTSGLSAGQRFMGTGFGAAWPDGYGINYLAGPNLIKFGIESKYSCPTTSTTIFKHHLVQALRDMRRVCEAAVSSSSSSSMDMKSKM